MTYFFIHRCRPCSDSKQCFNFDQSIDTKIIMVCIFGKYWKKWSVFWEKVVCIWSVIQTFFFYRPLCHHWSWCKWIEFDETIFFSIFFLWFRGKTVCQSVIKSLTKACKISWWCRTLFSCDRMQLQYFLQCVSCFLMLIHFSNYWVLEFLTKRESKVGDLKRGLNVKKGYIHLIHYPVILYILVNFNV